jgi:hypothetical protein
MKNIKVISISDLDENGWQNYFNLIIEIDRKFSPGNISDDGSWQDFRAKILKRFEINKDSVHNEYLLSCNGKSKAWLAIRKDSNGCFFVFNTLYKKIPGSIIKTILSVVYDYTCRENTENTCYWSFNERCNSALRKAGAEVVEELITTRLEREKMNPGFYHEIVHNTDTSGYSLSLFTSFPEHVVDDFTLLMNEIFRGIDSLNPYGTVIETRTGDFWLRKYGNEKDSGSEMKMFMLFDSENKIAAYCSLFVDPANPLTVRHGGGFTVVSPKHRGKGFARFLKAKTYLLLLEENSQFKYITTDTMPWNKYMYRINEEFGFTSYEHGAEFTITKEFLENYLKLK